MRVLVISDVHANLTALDEVLADANSAEWLGRTGFDAIWSLGDIVGYGPWPNECIERLQQFDGHVRVAGNHDWAALGRLDVEEFNREARKMVLWTQRQIDPASLAYLRGLPDQPLLHGDFTITHASPRAARVGIHQQRQRGARELRLFRYPLLPGRPHPRAADLSADARSGGGAGSLYSLWAGVRPRYLPGRPAQPDHQPRQRGAAARQRPCSSYALLDTEQALWRYRRVRYDVEITQAAMRKAGLPDRLIVRLAYGW